MDNSYHKSHARIKKSQELFESPGLQLPDNFKHLDPEVCQPQMMQTPQLVRPRRVAVKLLLIVYPNLPKKSTPKCKNRDLANKRRRIAVRQVNVRRGVSAPMECIFYKYCITIFRKSQPLTANFQINEKQKRMESRTLLFFCHSIIPPPSTSSPS